MHCLDESMLQILMIQPGSQRFEPLNVKMRQKLKKMGISTLCDVLKPTDCQKGYFGPWTAVSVFKG